MRNPIEELKENKAKWITLLVYAVICLITGIIGGWGALSIALLIPSVCVLIFWLQTAICDCYFFKYLLYCYRALFLYLK